jgi:hypothetical protein
VHPLGHGIDRLAPAQVGVGEAHIGVSTETCARSPRGKIPESLLSTSPTGFTAAAVAISVGIALDAHALMAPQIGNGPRVAVRVDIALDAKRAHGIANAESEEGGYRAIIGNLAVALDSALMQHVVAPKLPPR